MNKIFWTREQCERTIRILAIHELMPAALEEISKRFGLRCTYAVVQGAFKRAGLESPNTYLKRVEPDLSDIVARRKLAETRAQEDGKQFVRLVELVKKPIPFSALCDKLDLSPKKAKELILQARAEGLKVHVENDHVGLRFAEPLEHVQATRIAPVLGKRQKIAVISDTHLGSKYCLRDQLKDFVHYAYDSGVREILHPGDVLDGDYGHGKFEMTHMGIDEQTRDLYEVLPALPGLTYHGITGNHDATFTEKSGVDTGDFISNYFKNRGRNDFMFYGNRGAFVKLRGVVTHLWHPRSGGSYASCYDEATEVLTNRGWRKFSELLGGEKIATLSSDHRVEWQEPTARQRYLYSGPMHKINSRLVDLLVTPDHDLFVADAPLPEQPRIWRRARASECVESWFAYSHHGRWRMKKNALPQVGPCPETYTVSELDKRYNKPVLHLGRVSIRSVLKFLGYYVAEGSINKGRSGHPEGGVTLAQFRAANEDTHLDMARTIRDLGVSPMSTDVSVTGTSRELAALALQCGRGSAEKFVPRWVKELDASLLAVFFDAYMRGDGHRSGNSSIGGATTVSRQLADDLQEIALRLGFSASVKEGPPHNFGKLPVFKISFNGDKNEPRLDQATTIENYNGFVYDVTVPNHVLYVRRNGKACWSGNSYPLQKKIEGYGSIKPQILLAGHWHRFVFVYERGVNAIACPTFQAGQSAFSKSLTGQPAIGGLLLGWDLTRDGTIREFSLEKRTYYEVERPVDLTNYTDAKPVEADEMPYEVTTKSRSSSRK